jgi:hypothetical protein
MLPVITNEVWAQKFAALSAKAGAKLQELAAELATELMDNYPEYSSEWIQCKSWDYGMDPAMEKHIRPGSFTFAVADPDEGDCEVYETRVVTQADVATALPAFWMAVTAGLLNPGGIGSRNFWDPSDWDSDALDCLMQYYFYGDVVYG